MYDQLNPKEYISWNFIFQVFIQENEFENNVCKISPIVFLSQFDKQNKKQIGIKYQVQFAVDI